MQRARPVLAVVRSLKGIVNVRITPQLDRRTGHNNLSGPEAEAPTSCAPFYGLLARFLLKRQLQSGILPGGGCRAMRRAHAAPVPARPIGNHRTLRMDGPGLQDPPRA